MSGKRILEDFRWGIGAVALLAVGFAATGLEARPAAVEAEAVVVRHLRLVSTTPAADAVLSEAPEEVRVVFSEEPGSTTLRLTGVGEALVPTTEAIPDPDDAKVSFIRPEAPLVAGVYTLHWRVIARDGHTQRGTFDFRVAAD